MRRVALIDYRKSVLQGNCGDTKALEPGTVKIDVAAYSICGSDITLYRGERSLENERYFGRELSDVVADPGGGANGVKKDMRVASGLSRACGHCWNCCNGLLNYCRSVNNALLPEGFSEEILASNMPEYSSISPVPDTIGDTTATLLGPTSCAYHVTRRTDVKRGRTAVVFGIGPMGLITARIIKSMDIDVIVRVDNSKTRLEKVRNLGLISVADSNNGNWQNQIFKICGSKGADVIIGLTGALPVLQGAFRVIRPGGRIVVGGVYSGFTDQAELLSTMRKKLTILGSRGSHPHLETDGTSAAVDTLVRLQDGLKKLITVYGYKGTLKTFDDMMSGLAIKPAVRFRS